MPSADDQPVQPGGRAPAPPELKQLQDFLNSVDVEAGTDQLQPLSAASAFLADLGLLPPAATLSRAQQRALLELRTHLRALVEAGTHGRPADPAVPEGLARLADGAGLTLRVVDSGLRLASTRTGGAGIVGSLLCAVEAATTSGQWDRLRTCANSGCAWIFWDSSRNHAGKWCSMAICGNRAKVRAHRQRQTE